MRVAQVTNLMESVPPMHQHGLEQLVYYLCEGLVDLGVDVTLYGTGDSITRAKLIPILPKATMRDKLFKGWVESVSVLATAAAFADQNKFDIIHDHMRFVPDLFAGLLKIPVVTTLHHPIDFEAKFVRECPNEYKKYFDKSWLKLQSKANVVAVSEFQAREFEKLYGYKPKVIHNGIRLQSYKSQIANCKREYIAFLGYITKNKGVAEAVQAVMQTDEQLIIAGPLDNWEGNQNYFNTRVKQFIDDQKIKYIGPVSGDEKWGFLAAAKAVLMPAMWDEPFGLVAIEALSLGTPVIAFRRGALPEIIEDGKSGYIVDTVEEMSSVISKIGEISRLECRKRVEEKFTAEVMARNYLNYYKEILSR